MSKKDKKINLQPSLISNDKKPNDVNELINMYGTYNIQPTAASDTTYPAIAQGIPESEINRLNKEAKCWKNKNKKSEKI